MVAKFSRFLAIRYRLCAGHAAELRQDHCGRQEKHGSSFCRPNLERGPYPMLEAAISALQIDACEPANPQSNSYEKAGRYPDLSMSFVRGASTSVARGRE